MKMEEAHGEQAVARMLRTFDRIGKIRFRRTLAVVLRNRELVTYISTLLRASFNGLSWARKPS